MTLSVNGADIGAIAETAAWIGSIVGTLVVCLIVYLLVRPSRRARDRKAREADPAETEELWRIVDLMERRLALLERALAGKIERRPAGENEETRLFAPVEDDRDSGRK